MPFQLTESFISDLSRAASARQRNELEQLILRSQEVPDRMAAAIEKVKDKFGTLNDNCFPLALAYIDLRWVDKMAINPNKRDKRDIKEIL